MDVISTLAFSSFGLVVLTWLALPNSTVHEEPRKVSIRRRTAERAASNA